MSSKRAYSLQRACNFETPTAKPTDCITERDWALHETRLGYIELPFFEQRRTAPASGYGCVPDEDGSLQRHRANHKRSRYVQELQRLVMARGNHDCMTRGMISFEAMFDNPESIKLPLSPARSPKSAGGI